MLWRDAGGTQRLSINSQGNGTSACRSESSLPTVANVWCGYPDLFTSVTFPLRAVSDLISDFSHRRRLADVPSSTRLFVDSRYGQGLSSERDSAHFLALRALSRARHGRGLEEGLFLLSFPLRPKAHGGSTSDAAATIPLRLANGTNPSHRDRENEMATEEPGAGQRRQFSPLSSFSLPLLGLQADGRDWLMMQMFWISLMAGFPLLAIGYIMY